MSTYRVLLEVVDLAILNPVLNRLESFGIELADTLLTDACHKAVLRGDLEVFVSGLRHPLVIFLVQTLDPGSLLVRSQ